MPQQGNHWGRPKKWWIQHCRSWWILGPLERGERNESEPSSNFSWPFGDGTSSWARAHLATSVRTGMLLPPWDLQAKIVWIWLWHRKKSRGLEQPPNTSRRLQESSTFTLGRIICQKWVLLQCRRPLCVGMCMRTSANRHTHKHKHTHTDTDRHKHTLWIALIDVFVHGTYVYLLAYNVMVRNHVFFEDRGNVAVLFDRPASARAGSTTLVSEQDKKVAGQQSAAENIYIILGKLE